MAALTDFFDCQKFGIASLPCPKIMGSYIGKQLVIVASGRCVWDDLDRLGVHGGTNNGWDILCVNDIVMHYPGHVEHLYSNDHYMLEGWLKARRRQFIMEFGPPKHIHSCNTGAQHNWPWPGHGTSTLGAVYTGLALGYDRIVICGAPLDNSGHYFDPGWVTLNSRSHPVGQSNFENEVRTKEGGVAYWAGAARMFRGKVKSMSGRTREVLGAP